ncbi:uncharacterized protein [Panulirus ornatus]|uniref:uncharacterized protein isoform X4 n=1 Tax=Panulirus ornatus TaxID=150431 RepID=UPI003A89D0E8
MKQYLPLICKYENCVMLMFISFIEIFCRNWQHLVFGRGNNLRNKVHWSKVKYQAVDNSLRWHLLGSLLLDLLHTGTSEHCRGNCSAGNNWCRWLICIYPTGLE